MRKKNIFVAGFAWWCSVVLAAPHCPSKPLTLAYFESGLSYANGQGLNADVLAELQKRSHCHFETSEMPRNRIWAEIQNGGLAMSVSGIATPEREKFAWFAPYLRQKNYAVLSVVSASPAEFMSRPDYVWGAVRGYVYGSYYQPFLSDLSRKDRLVEFPDVKTAQYMLDMNRIQGIFLIPMAYRAWLTTDRKHRYQIVDWAPTQPSLELGLVLSKKYFVDDEA